MPRVSVVIPAHNAAAHLSETLASVQAQTFEDWEIVAVDDGSTDETWSILQSAGDRVSASRHETARGPAAARNRALREIAGELVVFLDADDLLEPGYLASQVTCLDAARASGRRVGIVTCDARILDEEGYAPYTYREMLPDREAPLNLEGVLERNSIYIASLVPADVGTSVGWFDEDLFGTEDFGLWLKILERGFEAILNPEPLAVYRRGTGTISANVVRQGVNNRRAYALALARGKLNARQRAIAHRAIRYNRAMEAVAELRFQGFTRASLRACARQLPLLIWVAFSYRRLWGQWFAVLRTGRQTVAATGRRR
jgi:glycosyltransferase involved in cell wall biosynthesis